MVKRTGDIVGDKAPKPLRIEWFIVFALALILLAYCLSVTGTLDWILKGLGL